MESSALTIQYSAQFFVIVLNGLMLVPLVLSWLGNRKPYLLLFCLAGMLEIARQVPNALLATQDSTTLLIGLSLFFQFFASVSFLAGLFYVSGKFRKRELAALALPSAAFLVMLVTLRIAGLPTEQSHWVIAALPMSVLSALIVWQSWRVRPGLSAGKLFLGATSLALLAIRIYVPFLGLSDFFYLIYYLENLLFPLLLASITVLELESANQRIAALHEQRKQSEQELQFVVDNALDVILMTDQVGLLKNWNKPAEAIFGYSAAQTVGKMHIDELFVDKHWHDRLDDYAEFNSRIEHLEGGVHDVHVRMQSVTSNRETNMVFVIRDVSAMERLTG